MMKNTAVKAFLLTMAIPVGQIFDVTSLAYKAPWRVANIAIVNTAACHIKHNIIGYNQIFFGKM